LQSWGRALAARIGTKKKSTMAVARKLAVLEAYFGMTPARYQSGEVDAAPALERRRAAPARRATRFATD
jgi:hypothetical protein